MQPHPGLAMGQDRHFTGRTRAVQSRQPTTWSSRRSRAVRLTATVHAGGVARCANQGPMAGFQNTTHHTCI